MTIGVIDVEGEAVVYVLCPECMAEVVKRRQRRRKMERQVEQRLVAMIFLQDGMYGGSA